MNSQALCPARETRVRVKLDIIASVDPTMQSRCFVVVSPASSNRASDCSSTPRMNGSAYAVEHALLATSTICQSCS